jgi:hypothetical protein
MSNTDKPADPVSFFGTTYFPFQHELYKARKYVQAHFTLYVSCRAGIDKWEFNHSDIRFNTGIHHQDVTANCKAFEANGIFIRNGTSLSGSPKYKLDRSKFVDYLKSGRPLNVKTRSANCSNVNANTKDTDSNCSRVSTVDMYTVDRGGVHGGQGGMSTVDGVGCPPCTPNNKEKKEDENEDTQTREVCVCEADRIEGTESILEGGVSTVDTLSIKSVKSKSSKFVKQVKELQSSEPNLGINISKDAIKQVSEFLNVNPDIDADQLFDTFSRSVNLAHFHRTAKTTDGSPVYAMLGTYDPMFAVNRSANLGFFLSQYNNIVSSLN